MADPTTEVVRALAATLAEHRFVADRSQDGTLNFGWCADGDAWATKHVSEHEAHLAEKVAAALGLPRYTPDSPLLEGVQP